MPDHRKIVTNFWAKPIPPRQFDWSAHFDGDEPNDDGHMTMGYGATERDAIDDLIAQTDDDCPGHVASDSDPKVCGRCGTHIDSLRPDDQGGAA